MAEKFVVIYPDGALFRRSTVYANRDNSSPTAKFGTVHSGTVVQGDQTQMLEFWQRSGSNYYLPITTSNGQVFLHIDPVSALTALAQPVMVRLNTEQSVKVTFPHGSTSHPTVTYSCQPHRHLRCAVGYRRSCNYQDKIDGPGKSYGDEFKVRRERGCRIRSTCYPCTS